MSASIVALSGAQMWTEGALAAVRSAAPRARIIADHPDARNRALLATYGRDSAQPGARCGLGQVWESGEESEFFGVGGPGNRSGYRQRGRDESGGNGASADAARSLRAQPVSVLSALADAFDALRYYAGAVAAAAEQPGLLLVRDYWFRPLAGLVAAGAGGNAELLIRSLPTPALGVIAASDGGADTARCTELLALAERERIVVLAAEDPTSLQSALAAAGFAA